MMLKESLAILAATKLPPLKDRLRAVADINAQCSALETRLAIPHRIHTLNSSRAMARLTELETMLAATGSAPASATVPAVTGSVMPTAALTPAAAVQAVATPTLPPDTGILKASLVEFRKMDAATRLQFAADGGALSKSDFDKLTLSAKSKFCTLGGKILDDTPASSRNISTAGRNFGQS